MTTSDAAAMPSAAPAGIVRQLGVDTRYVLFSFPLALASFIVLIVGISLGSGLAVTVIGLPILAGVLYAARGFADIERLRISTVLRQPRVRPRYRVPEDGAGVWRRVLVPLADSQSWLDVAYGCLRFPVTVTSFVVTVSWWVSAVGGVLYWTYDWAIPRSPNDEQLSELLGLGDSAVVRIAVNTALGLFFLITLPIVVRGCAVAEAALARSLLTGVASMRDRITLLEEQKRAAASAEATALRRLERDIHDGPQQRLVRLAMDLSRARQLLVADPQAAARTLDEALDQTRDTLTELRALSRGIAPPILVDRGLPSALAALAARSVVPVELAVDAELGTAEGRLAPEVETTAYFVVAEALTNVAKHSRAASCRVDVSRSASTRGTSGPSAAKPAIGQPDPTGAGLEIAITDDGAGGAHLSKGHGLAGVADRVRAAGGTLTVSSPPGGPTIIQAWLPTEGV